METYLLSSDDLDNLETAISELWGRKGNGDRALLSMRATDRQTILDAIRTLEYFIPSIRSHIDAVEAEDADNDRREAEMDYANEQFERRVVL